MITRCCICLSLRTGTIIIAVLSTIGALFCLGSGVAAVLYGNIFGENVSVNQMVYYGISLYISVIDGEGHPTHFDTTDYYFTAKVTIPFGLVIAAIHIIFLYGTVKKIPKLFVPWLVWQLSFMVTGLLGIILIMLVAPLALISLIGVLFQFYYCSVVYNHYKELKHSQKLDGLPNITAPPQNMFAKF